MSPIDKKLGGKPDLAGSAAAIGGRVAALWAKFRPARARLGHVTAQSPHWKSLKPERKPRLTGRDDSGQNPMRVSAASATVVSGQKRARLTC
jgi:hypothetical protein